jgi:hypothetical protein
MKKLIAGLFTVSIMTLVSCSRGNHNSNSDLIVTQEINMEHNMMNFETTKREGTPHGGQYYSSTDSIKQYGIGYQYILDDSLKKKNITVYVSCWIREDQLPVEGGMTIGLSNADGIKNWHSFTIKNKGYKAGQWEKISDSVVYTKDLLNEKFIKIGVCAFKKDGKDLLDVDDLQIKYKFSN